MSMVQDAHVSFYKEKGNDFAHSMIPFYLVAICTVFNFGLCFVNTNIHSVSAANIAIVEMFLTAAALYLGFHRLSNPKLFWITIIAIHFALIVVLSVAKGYFLIKPLRDFLIMPIFLVLGFSAYASNIRKPIFLLTVGIFILGVMEASMPKIFLDVFNFKQYFISKGVMEDLFWLTENTFASGVRPGGRFLMDFPDIHRISSVFIEPVSLGFFGFIVGVYFIATKHDMSRAAYVSALVMCILLIWLADGRMAFGCLILMLLFHGIFVRLDHRLSLLIFPLVFFLCYVIDAMGVLDVGGEGLGARIRSTMHSIDFSSFNLYLGLNPPAYMSDSALADILGNQGLIAVMLFWMAPVLFMKKVPPEARIYIFGTQMYITLGFLLSPAIFSIKTGALLWFLFGYLLNADRARALRPEGYSHDNR
jgi:putative polymerase